MRDPLVAESAAMLASLRRALRTASRAGVEAPPAEDWARRLGRIGDKVAALSLDDPGRGAALANVIEARELLAEWMENHGYRGAAR